MAERTIKVRLQDGVVGFEIVGARFDKREFARYCGRIESFPFYFPNLFQDARRSEPSSSNRLRSLKLETGADADDLPAFQEEFEKIMKDEFDDTAVSFEGFPVPAIPLSPEDATKEPTKRKRERRVFGVKRKVTSVIRDAQDEFMSTDVLECGHGFHVRSSLSGVGKIHLCFLCSLLEEEKNTKKAVLESLDKLLGPMTFEERIEFLKLKMKEAEQQKATPAPHS